MSIYMKFPGINGNVSVKGFEKQIELTGIDHIVSRKLNTAPGRTSNREGSHPAIGELVITKKMDEASPLLYQEALTGDAKSPVVITRVTTSGSLSKYAEYTLENVIITGYQVNESPAVLDKEGALQHKDYPTETIYLNFDKVQFKFTPHDKQQKPQTPITTGYDVSQAVKE